MIMLLLGVLFVFPFIAYVLNYLFVLLFTGMLLVVHLETSNTRTMSNVIEVKR